MKIVEKIEQQLSRQFEQLISSKQTKRSLLLIQGILESKTVNLWSCAEAMSRQSDVDLTKEQLYGQFIDHFQTGRYDKLLKSYFLAIFHLTFHLSDGKIVMDRTEWKLGSRWHNILVIGYICHDSLVPLVWKDLGERKNSSTAERIALLNQLRAWWKATDVKLPPLILYADREFIGSQWFVYLTTSRIEFVIRLKANQKFRVWRNGAPSEKKYSVQLLSRYLKLFKLSHVEIVVADQVVIPFTYACATIVKDGKTKTQQWYLAANIAQPEKAAQHYISRWSIETTFGHTKSKGLNLEDFNLDGAHKMEIMLGLVAIVYAISIRQSLEEKLHEQVEVKTYKNGKQYPAQSTFKLGFERVREIVRNVKELYQLLFQSFKQITQRLFILKKSIVQ